MNLSNNTVLIAGGSAGIGFEIAKQFTQKGSHVIITGRNKERLAAAAAKLENVTAITLDITSEAEVDQLVAKIAAEFPNLNVLINNAGLAYVYDLKTADNVWKKAADEMNTNYVSLIRLTEKFLPLLLKQSAPAVVNVSSIVSIVPGVSLLTYSASKAAVHSFTQSLRFVYKDTALKVFELKPPLVATEFSAEIGGLEKGIPPAQVATEFLTSFEKDEYEIHVGDTAQLYELAKTSVQQALEVLNASE